MRIFAALALGLAMAATPAFADYYGLLTAARVDNLEVVRQLLEAGEDPNPPAYHDGYSPLQFAAGNGRTEMTRLLLDAGADTEYRDHNGERALLWAARWGHAETAALLLNAGSPPDAPLDPYGDTPLMKASSHGGNAETVARLLAAGADPNRFGHSGDTALHHAARYDNIEVLGLLLAAGANPNVIDSILLETPLHEAASGTETEAVRLLIEAGAAVEARNSDGETPLYSAARTGRDEHVRLLLAAHADPNALNGSGQLPILAAFQAAIGAYGNYEATALLLAERTANRDRALVGAIAAGFLSVAERLLAGGADVNAVDENGVSALAMSAFLADAAFFHRLAEAGADIGRFGTETLLAAAGAGNEAVAQAVLDAGIDADSRDPRGATPLLYAAKGAHVDMVRLLLVAGAVPISVDDLGFGADAYMEIVPELLESRIATRQASRAWRPTEHIEIDLAAMRERQATIRELLVEAAR